MHNFGTCKEIAAAEWQISMNIAANGVF